MPFKEITPRPFTPEAVRLYAVQAPGLYGISNAREWIYIGCAANIQTALLDFFQDPGSALMKKQPLGFAFEACDGAHWVASMTGSSSSTSLFSTGIHSTADISVFD